MLISAIITNAREALINIESSDNYSKFVGKLRRAVNNGYLLAVAFIHCVRR